MYLKIKYMYRNWGNQSYMLCYVLYTTYVCLSTIADIGGDSPEGFLRQRFQELCLSIDAFSSLEYVGTQTAAPPTDFSVLENAVTKQLMNTNVRSKRKPTVVFSALQVRIFYLLSLVAHQTFLLVLVISSSICSHCINHWYTV